MFNKPSRLTVTATINRVQISKPAQKRSRESLQRIYEATNKLLQDTSFDHLTVSEIAETANVAVGSVYQRFRSKDDLLWTMYGAYLDEADERARAMIDGNSDAELTDRIDLVIRFISSLFLKHRGIVRSLLLKYRHDPEQIPEFYTSRIQNIYATMEKFIWQVRPRNTSRRKVGFVFSMILACCREHILFANLDEVSHTSDDAEFAQNLAMAVGGVLLPWEL